MITATLNGVDMPPIEIEFLSKPQEIATDVQTLSGDIYTDFVNQTNVWKFSYSLISEEDYNVLKGIYDSQFTTYQYPLLSIPHYALEDKPVRMYINERNVWDNCGSVQNVQITFRETSQLAESS